MLSRHAIAVAALVRDRRILLVHRNPQRRWYPDCWDLVGGHIESGESPRDAVQRECAEEVGVRVIRLEPMPLRTSDPAIDIHGFLIKEWTGEPANLAPDEHDDLRWFTKDEIPGLVLADSATMPDILAALENESV